MVVREFLDYSNERILRRGESIRKLLSGFAGLVDFDLKGSVVVKFNSVQEFNEKFPAFKRIMDAHHVKGLEVTLSVVKSGEFKYLVRLLSIADKTGLVVDADYDRKKMIIYSPGTEENLDGLIELFSTGVLDKLMTVYHWEIRINDFLPDGRTVRLEKKPYTHVYFRPVAGKGFIRVNKHFTLFFNGKYSYAVDLGKIGNKVYTPDVLDFVMLTHHHTDHTGSFIHKSNSKLKPVVITNLPTVELVLSKTYDFPTREDLREIMTTAFVNSKVFLGDTMVRNNIYSGHAYGTMFYIEDYLLGLSFIYMSDINPSSRAFKFTNVKRSVVQRNPDVLAIEFPVYPKPRTLIPPNGIIGTTSGEYEEVLTLLPKGSKIMIDENSNIVFFEVIRRKFKSFLTREGRGVRVSVGTVEEFKDGSADYFITTKGLAVSYGLKYGMLSFVTNSKPTVRDVKVMKVKTHPTLKEVEELIQLVNPKILIIHHYNGDVRKASALMSFIEKHTDVRKVYTTPAEGDFLELFKNVQPSTR